MPDTKTHVDWRLRELLKAEQISVYALAKQMGGETKRPALHAITRADIAKRPRRVSFDLLAELLDALSILKGGRVFQISELIEIRPATVRPAGAREDAQ